MWLTFRAYGNYENRGKARTRYMQEALGGAENYRKAYQEKLQEVLASGEQLDLSREEVMAAAGIKEKQSKTGDGSSASGERVAGAETAGTLYGYLASDWRTAAPGDAGSLGELMQTIDGTELRLAPDETAYIINLTGAEAEKILEATKETAQTKFETSGKLYRCVDLSGWCTRFAGSVTGVCKGGRGGTDPGRRTSADSYFRMSVFLRYPPDWTDGIPRRRADGRWQAQAGICILSGRK